VVVGSVTTSVLTTVTLVQSTDTDTRSKVNVTSDGSYRCIGLAPMVGMIDKKRPYQHGRRTSLGREEGAPCKHRS
jgi:hypothetical protein